MTINTTLELLQEYGQDYLLLDGRRPCVTDATVNEEFSLYGIDAAQMDDILAEFQDIAGQQLERASNIRELSGGQQVILATLLALKSRAKRLMFVNFFLALHESKKARLGEMLRQSPKQIHVLENMRYDEARRRDDHHDSAR